MSPNKRTVERCLDGFGKSDARQVVSCLTEDVEWMVPGAFHLSGKAAFNEQLGEHEAQGPPTIEVFRLVEEDDVVVAEGTVRTSYAPGEITNLAFCDVFLMRDGLIRHLTTYLVKI